jgi:hypothetical protein
MGHALDMETTTRAMLARDAAPKPKRGRRKRPARHHLPWTAAEDKVLLLEWGEVCPRVLRSKLPGRSWCAIYCHATRELRLPSGLPQGTVALTAAATRLGFADPGYIRRLAARHGVEIRRHPHPPDLGPRRQPRRCIDWQDILDAYLSETNATETIHAAARRHGIHNVTLWRWLVADGVPTSGLRGRPSHIDRETIDRVVTARRTLAAAPRGGR